MNEVMLTCKKCGADIELTDTLAAPLLETAKLEYERKLAEKSAEIHRQKEEMDERRLLLEKAETDLDATIERRVEARLPSAIADELASKDGEVAALRDALARASEVESKKLMRRCKLNLQPSQKNSISSRNNCHRQIKCSKPLSSPRPIT